MSDKDVQVTSPQKLKSLVEALDLMHDEENWIPSDKQWRRIKEMIESLDENVPVQVTQVQTPVAVANGPTPRLPTAMVNRGPNPATSGGINFPAIPVGDAPVLSDGPAEASALSPVASPRQAPVSSSDEIPANPPGSPGI